MLVTSCNLTLFKIDLVMPRPPPCYGLYSAFFVSLILMGFKIMGYAGHLAYKAGAYVQDSLLESSGLLIVP
jgi:hypothetical protein